MAPSAEFDQKVEALRRLREKRLARANAAAAGEVSVDASTGGFKEEKPAASAPVQPAAPARAEQLLDEAADADVSCEGCVRQTRQQQQQQRPDPACPGGAGEADALFCAGHMHERGIHDCPQDLSVAAEMYLCAAEAGHVVAQWRLGELLEAGRGVERNVLEAAGWYRKSAEAGNMHAQSALALLLEEGTGGVTVDDEEAARWHLAAAEQGHALSQYCLARCLVEGRGLPKDRAEAMRWLQKSADAGFKPACEDLSTYQYSAATSTAAAKAAGTQRDTEAADRDLQGAFAEEDGTAGLLQRIASLLQGLDPSDPEAAAMLDELMSAMPTGLAGHVDLGGDEVGDADDGDLEQEDLEFTDGEP